MPIRFRFRWIPFIAAVAAAAIGIALGNWQTRRAQEKEAMEAMLNARASMPPLRLNPAPPPPDAVEYRRVEARGEFLHGWDIYLDNRPYEGRAGFYLLTPLRLEQGDAYVLVMRGWLPRDPADRMKLQKTATPSGSVTVEGIARRDAGHVMELGRPETLRPGAIAQNVSVADVGQAAGIRLLPFVMEQTGTLEDGLVRDWPRPSSGAGRHRGYAFQWYALAALAPAFFIVTGRRRERK